MAGSRDPRVEKILSVIEYGTLPVEETRKRVEALIQSETRKPKEFTDIGLINACEDLLWELGTNGSLPFDSRLEENREAVEVRLSSRPARHARPVVRTAAMVAALFVFSLIGESVLHREWLEARSSPDEQQFVLQGFEIDPGIIGRSIAERAEAEPLSTRDWGQVVEYLGFEPLVPKINEERWNTEIYYASTTPIFIKLTVSYHQIQDKTTRILYDTYCFPDFKDAYAAFEQNGRGSMTEIAGHQVYISENMGDTSIFYYEKNCTYLVTGNAEYDDLLQFAEEIMKGL